ncbi:hypothetical protein [[Clostridium] dakarense]|uniref:hypothetical protein n=1 Tax=Faecalimicrobium dakarense TaxID=1301100 RepID=UPI0004B16FB6|nr:hypothetical protein [[Clostridium] dakarense]
MSRINKNKMKVVVPLSIAIAVTSANSLVLVNANSNSNKMQYTSNSMVQSDNLIKNSGFENENSKEFWEFIGGSGIASNNPYNGKHFYLDGGSENKIKQTVIAPKTGNYDVSAWLSIGGRNSKISVIDKKSGEIISQMEIDAKSTYNQYVLNQVYLEKGAEVEVVIIAGSGWVNGDEITMNLSETEYNDIKTIEFYNQVGNVNIDNEKKSIEFHVPYGTDVSQIKLKSIEVSRGATVNYKSDDVLDFTTPQIFKVSSEKSSEDWTVNCIVKEKQAIVTSSNKEIEDGFNWAMNKTSQFVMTGKKGIVNKDENRPNGDGTGEKEYLPSYWAGYYDRTAFYGRDFVHQATGAQIAGLRDENFSIFKVFAKNATESRKWYTLWAFNFDGSPHTIDYKNDNNFVREVPAQFELVEKAYEQYLWTGDKRYIEDDELWNFYTKVMTDYIDLHDDQNPNGIAEGKGGIFQGSCTYNERGEHPIEAGDAIGSQYQATLAYAGMLEARGEKKESQKWYKKAESLKKYFNEEWSVIDPNNKDENYARIIDKDGKKKNDFGKK